MKLYRRSLRAIAFILILSIMSCQKETRFPEMNTNEEMRQSKKPDDTGFVENDMVMYWNDKTNIVATTWNPQPVRARFYAITQIAVHDALNAIKPKYQRFAL
ncbi:MAG TPA: hypothetical protein VF476_04570 [Chitinophagaceae bacterium]